MKICIKRTVKYTLDNRTVEEVLPGEYEVPRQIDKEVATLMLSMGKAVIVPTATKQPKFKKKAPENKVLKAKRTK
jgi:hypothetical protein